MADPRESILARLVSVIAAAVPAAEVARNKIYFDDAEGQGSQRVAVLEGKETRPGGEDGANRAPGSAGGLINMQPQLLLSNFDAADVVGSGLNEARAAIIKAVTSDAQLKALTHRGYGGHYIDMESDLAFGADALGRMALVFQFTYALIPSEL